MKSNLYCGNCGKTGHNYRSCMAPIISLGIVLCDKRKIPFKYLMIQRRDTLGFVEFMRGKYLLTNLTYLKKLFTIMTKKERELIVNNDFDTLWDKLWMKNDNRYTFNEYSTSKDKFNKLKSGTKIDNKTVTFISLNNEVPMVYESPEWGFPKGRRNLHENDLDCAKREFEEETGIDESNYELMNIKKINENFIGSNNIRYRHIYYIGNLLKDIDLKINPENKHQITEISNINWFTLEECKNSIRPYNVEKKKVIEKIDDLIKKH